MLAARCSCFGSDPAAVFGPQLFSLLICRDFLLTISCLISHLTDKGFCFCFCLFSCFIFYLTCFFWFKGQVSSLREFTFTSLSDQNQHLVFIYVQFYGLLEPIHRIAMFKTKCYLLGVFLFPSQYFNFFIF